MNSLTTLPAVIAYCEQVAARCADGMGDALDALAQLRAVMASAQDAIGIVEPMAMEEALKHRDKTFVHNGVTFIRRDGRRDYDYSHIEEWAKRKADLAAIEERAKNAAMQNEKGLRAVTADGEVVEAAIVTYGKASLSIGKA